MVDFRGDSTRVPNFKKNFHQCCTEKIIIEGTQKSLARLGLDYHDVDIIFAHRHGHSGTD